MHRSFSTSTACEVLLSQSKCSQDFRHATGLPVVEEGHAQELTNVRGINDSLFHQRLADTQLNCGFGARLVYALDRLHLVRWPAAPRANRVLVERHDGNVGGMEGDLEDVVAGCEHEAVRAHEFHQRLIKGCVAPDVGGKQGLWMLNNDRIREAVQKSIQNLLRSDLVKAERHA